MSVSALPYMQSTAPDTPAVTQQAQGGSTQSAQAQMTPQQQAVFQQIVQQLVNQSKGGLSPAAGATQIQQALTQSGQFTPQQIQGVVQAWNTDNVPAGGMLTDQGGGNTNAELASWPAELASGLGQANAQATSAAATNAASPTNNANPAAAAANPLQSVTPATIQGQFPGGIPSYMASGVGNVNQVSPTTVNPQMSIAATEAYLQPQFQQQNQALTANLANAGIVGGTTAQAVGQLGQQQQTTLQNDIQPFLQAGALANQSTNLAGQQSNQSAALQGGEYNATQQNQQQQFNIQNLLQTGQIDAATANQMMQYVMGLQNQDWLAQLGAQTNLATTAEGATTSAFNPVYQQPSGTNLSGLGSAFASNNTGQAAAPAAAPTNIYNYAAPAPTGAATTPLQPGDAGTTSGYGQ